MKKSIVFLILIILLIGAISTMAIRHSVSKTTGEKGYASEWNADHTVTDPNTAKRSATLIVAANNSKDKERADYVCDGISDYAEIQQALNDLPTMGGKVLLLEGDYDLYNGGGLVKIDIAKDGTTIEGQGAGTHLTNSGTGGDALIFDVGNKNKFKICNLWIEQVNPDLSVTLWIDGGDDLVVEELWLTNQKFWFQIDNSNRVKLSNWAVNCADIQIFGGANNKIIIGNIVIDSTGVSRISLRDNFYSIVEKITGENTNLLYRGNSDYNIFANNICNSIQISDATCDENVIHGNLVDLAIVDGGTNTHQADNWVF